MKSFVSKVSRNKKKILYMFFFFFLAISLPITGYFISSDRSFDDRGEAWWDLDFDSERPSWTEIDFEEEQEQEQAIDTEPTPSPSDGETSNAVSITSFNISPSTVEEGGRITVSWNSTNANSCTLTTDTGSSEAPTSASRNINVTRGVGTHSYELVCRNANSQDSKRATFTVVSSSSDDRDYSDTDDETTYDAQELSECLIDAHCRTEPPYEVCFASAGVCLRGDVNNNEEVSMSDFNTFREDFVSYKKNGWSDTLKRSDLNEDERISMADYSIFVHSYRIFRSLD